MKNKSFLVLLALVLGLGLYAYFGEYKREIQETKTKEEKTKIVTLQRDQIKRITLDKGTTEIVLEKTADGWNLVKPVQDEADNEIAESFLDQITGEKIVDTIERPDGINWKDYGLDPSMGRVILENNNGETEEVQVSMTKNFEGLVFLRKNNAPKIFTSSITWQSFLAKPVDGFRNLRLFRFSLSKVNEIQIQNSKGRISLKNQDAQWISEERPEWKMDQNAIREILTQISLAKGTTLATSAPSGKPELSLSLKLDEKSWAAQFYQDKKTKEWIVSLNLPQMTIQYPPQTLDNVRSLELIDLRDKSAPFKFDRELVQRVKVKNPLNTLSLIKQKPEWKLEKPDAEYLVNSVTTQEMIEKTHRLQVYKYLAKPAGSVNFTSSAQFSDESGRLLFEMKWSDFKDHEAYMMTSLSPEIFQIDDAQINRLEISEMVKKVPEMKDKKE